jgi:hypothetical protein
LVLVHLDHAPVVAERKEQTRQLAHHLLIGGRQVMELFEVEGSALAIAELIATEASAPVKQSADERTVKDLGQRTRESCFHAGEIVRFASKRF